MANRSHRSPAERSAFLEAQAADHEPTPAEEAMAALLLEMGVKYRFQLVMTNWKNGKGVILDFALPEDGIPETCIEVDGREHRPGPDGRRDRALAMLGIKTVRVRNQDILEDREGVRAKLMEAFEWT
jgi:very-short-patch-repair endonuclease